MTERRALRQVPTFAGGVIAPVTADVSSVQVLGQPEADAQPVRVSVQVTVTSETAQTWRARAIASDLQHGDVLAMALTRATAATLTSPLAEAVPQAPTHASGLVVLVVELDASMSTLLESMRRQSGLPTRSAVVEALLAALVDVDA